MAFAVGVLAVAIAGATRTTKQVQTLGVLPVLPVAPIAHGQEACQTPIALAQPVERVRFNIGTQGKPGPALAVTVRDAATHAPLGSGRVAAGWKDNGTAQNVSVGHVSDARPVALCVRNLGRVRGYVFGDLYQGVLGTGPKGVRPTSTTTHATIDGVPIPGDMSASFVTAGPRSMLSLIPAMFRRASVFRPGFVGPWLYWLLLAGVLFGAPLALAGALRAASLASPPAEGPIAGDRTDDGSGN